tara:strand:+ start:222 stop:563 length:342 start_codon:yes stop_codon:yes gene_type:complete
MFNTKFIISTTIFITLLIVTSAIKNKTRILEKKITNINFKILSKKKDVNESQLDFHYLSSPAEIEKRLDLLGLENYQPISHSKIFLKISDFTKIQNKVSTLKNLNEKKIQKKN